MTTTLAARLLLAASLTAAATARADEIEDLPVTVTFVVSGGFWEDDGEDLVEIGPAGDGAPAAAVDGGDGGSGDGAPSPRRGYYKLVSVRQPDSTTRVYLQQIQSTADGPRRLASVELDELTAMRPYVTDIRPEDSLGVGRQPGFFGTVHLKTDPQALEPESWTVLIDEFGEIKVERATN